MIDPNSCSYRLGQRLGQIYRHFYPPVAVAEPTIEERVADVVEQWKAKQFKGTFASEYEALKAHIPEEVQQEIRSLCFTPASDSCPYTQGIVRLRMLAWEIALGKPKREEMRSEILRLKSLDLPEANRAFVESYERAFNEANASIQ